MSLDFARFVYSLSAYTKCRKCKIWTQTVMEKLLFCKVLKPRINGNEIRMPVQVLNCQFLHIQGLRLATSKVECLNGLEWTRIDYISIGLSLQFYYLWQFVIQYIPNVSESGEEEEDEEKEAKEEKD